MQAIARNGRRRSKVGRAEEIIRVVPSQVVSVIEQLFPAVLTQTTFQLTSDNTEAIMALLALIDQLPHELLPATSEQYNALVIAIAVLRNAPKRWEARPRDPVIGTPGGYSTSPVRLLYDTLKACPDEAPAPATTDLPFITDPEYRAALRLDISNAYQALANREWKAATVLAGSVVEALLLWGIQQNLEADYQKALNEVVAKGNVRRPRFTSLEEWDLMHYIAVAEQLQTITADTAALARLAKDFRNLIHPGKVQREAQTCTRGTTMAALAAVERVIECLTP